MSAYILPVIILLLLIFGAVKRVGVYDCFTEGAKEAAKLVFSIFPYIAAIYVGVQLFKASGMGEKLADIMSPFLTLIGIPKELVELIIIRPLSGSGSIALLEDIFDAYGADSYVARCASVIIGSSDTVFYIAAVYFSTSKVKKLRYAIPVSLIATFIGAIVSCLFCRIM
ncbi:MAG: nucleoside recognition domain-containing protein [Christensenellales bacterium]|jgi:spore maturation protein B